MNDIVRADQLPRPAYEARLKKERMNDTVIVWQDQNTAAVLNE